MNDTDLLDCASEPIHLLGRTQGFGVLLALDGHRRIARASANAPAWLGAPLRHLLGTPADRHLPRRDIDAAFAHARVAGHRRTVQHLYGVRWPGRAEPVDVTLHDSGGLVVIEAEPAGPGPADASRTLEAGTRDIATASSVQALADSAARTVAGLTGYDRVMVYRFAADGSGTVIAEALRGRQASYRGLRYPASDIPAQARTLYLQNPSRVIADAHDEGLQIASLDAAPLDLSLAALRSVSPVHLQYLRNMGTAASMSISLVIDGKLWGLIACHHRRPLRPTLACRAVAELLGRLYSLAIGRIEDAALAQDIEALLLKAPGVEPLVDPGAADAVRQDTCAALARLFGASGVAMRVQGQLLGWGSLPARDDLQAIATCAAGDAARSAVVAVESLCERRPDLQRLAPGCAGVLAVALSPTWNDWLLLLRDEVRRHVVWAGEPAKAIDRAGGRLRPRASFAAWRESVRWHAEPWKTADIDLAETLRVRLLEVMLAFREQRELEHVRRAARQQALLVRELNHRVRNMLGLVQGLVRQSVDGAPTIERVTERLEERVRALSRAYTQIERACWQPASLAGLLADETTAFAEPGQAVLDGEPISLEPNAYLAFAMVIHELATNARKYGALSVPGGRLRIAWRVTPDGALELHWAESGGPPVAAPVRRGFGTRLIAEGLAHQLDGRTQLDFLPGGMQATLRVPRGFLRGAGATEAAAPRQPVPSERPPAPRRALVVEDDPVIAFMAEAMLLRLGCVQVVVAGSTEAALSVLRTQQVDMALLDVNLGDHHSEAVAQRLSELGVPALLATGYSDTDELPEGLRGLPRVGKPYTEPDLERALALLAPLPA